MSYRGKVIVFHLFIAISLIILGGLIQLDWYRIRDTGKMITLFGVLYIPISILINKFWFLLPAPIKTDEQIKEENNKKAVASLIECKQLLDNGILTEEEYRLKSESLKQKIL